MGFFDSSSEAKSKTTPYRPEQLQGMLDRLETLGGTPMEMFPDQMFAGMTPEQTQSLQMRRDYAGGMGDSLISPTMGAWQGTLNAPDVANNPYVQDMLQQQQGLLNRNFQENLMPSIRSGAIGAGQLGGTRQGVAEGIAARGTQEALANQAAQTQMQAYGQGLEQQRFGLGSAPGMASFGMMPADIMARVGDIERGEQQMGINESVNRFNFAQQEPWQRLQQEAGMFNPLTLPYAETETETSESPSAFTNTMNALTAGFSGAMGVGGPGLLSSFMGSGAASQAPAAMGMYGGGGMGGGMGAGMGGGMSMGGAPSYGAALAGGGGAAPSSFMPMASMFSMSDRRLKANVEKIGETPGGQAVYSYTIFGVPQIGVMADESPADAVVKHSSGFDMVDYSRIR